MAACDPDSIEEARTDVELHWPDARSLVTDMFEGGPVALAWSRFTPAVRGEVAREFLASVECYRDLQDGYRLPCEVAFGSARTSGPPLRQGAWDDA